MGSESLRRLGKKAGRSPILVGASALLFVASLAASQRTRSQVHPDLKRLQGYWEGRGPGGECSVTISGNSLRYRQGDDFWFETSFTLPDGAEPKQLHATILRSPDETTIGTVVVTLFEVEDETLNLVVIEDFDEPPVDPVIAGWDRATDRYYLNRAEPPENEKRPPSRLTERPPGSAPEGEKE